MDLQTISSLGTYNPGPIYEGGFVSTCERQIDGGRPSERLWNTGQRAFKIAWVPLPFDNPNLTIPRISPFASQTPLEFVSA